MFLQQLITGLSVGSIYALMAVGYSLIYSLLNFTNFAHGASVLISRLDKDTLEYRLLYTQMLRNRNRVADAVLTACEYAELFLAQK